MNTRRSHVRTYTHVVTQPNWRGRAFEYLQFRVLMTWRVGVACTSQRLRLAATAPNKCQRWQIRNRLRVLSRCCLVTCWHTHTHEHTNTHPLCAVWFVRNVYAACMRACVQACLRVVVFIACVHAWCDWSENEMCGTCLHISSLMASAIGAEQSSVMCVFGVACDMSRNAQVATCACASASFFLSNKGGFVIDARRRRWLKCGIIGFMRSVCLCFFYATAF